MKRNLLVTLFAILASISIISAQSRSGSELYSQMANGYSTWDYVYSFEGLYSQSYDTFGADDFEVPTGETWDIASVKSVMKSYDAVTTMNVVFYSDDNGAPGTELHRFDEVSTNIVTNMPEYGVYEIVTNLPSTVSLTEGIYWVSISAHATSDYWQWLYQTNTTTNLSQTHVINPGGSMWLPTVWTPNVNYSGYYNVTFALYAPPVPNDLAITDITSPVSGELTTTETVEVVITNVGSADQSNFDVQYQINNGIAVVETVTSTISPNQSYIHTFSTIEDMSAMGDYTIDATVLLVGDEDPSNDSYQTIVTNYGPIYELNATSTSETTCSGLFTDAGGLFNGFTVNDGGTITFYPETSGSRIELDFTEFDFGYNMHHFVIYDGPTNSGNILYTYVEEGAAYGVHNDPPVYLRARNGSGALTVELIPYAYMGEDPGWVANLGCMTPENIDFTVLGLQLGEGFLHYNMLTTVGTRIVNSGATNQSRTVNLIEDGVIVETVTSNMLIPGEIQDIIFNWTPQVIGFDISLKVEIENDPGSTNDDNSIEVFVDIYSQYALVESFEDEPLIPEYWTDKMGVLEKKSYGAFHGTYYLQSPYNAPNDTLITPLLDIQANDVLSYEAKGYNKDFEIVYSSSIDGPWTVLESYPSALNYSWAHFETDISSLAGNNYFLGFAFADNGTYSGQFAVDMVGGPDKKFFDRNLGVFDYEVNQFPAIGRETYYQVTIKNDGLTAVSGSDYVVNLMVNSDPDALVSIQGEDITSFGYATFNFIYTFPDDIPTELFYEIDYENDEDFSNNISEGTAIYVQPEGTYDYFLEGDYDNQYPYNNYPIANNSPYSLSELVYYPNEIQGTGDITGITFEYYAKSIVPYVPIKIWMGTTTDSIMTEWITADQLDLVYDGTLTFDASSWEEIYIPLDTAFNYDGLDNLLIMIDKDEAFITGNVYFRTKDMNINHRGLMSSSYTTDIDPVSPDPSLYIAKYDHIPAMRFLIHDDDALVFLTEPVTDAEKGVEYFYEVIANNYQGEPITISQGEFFPSWLSITQTMRGTAIGAVAGTPNVLGDFDVQILVDDGSHQATQTYTITVLPVIEFITTPMTYVIAGENYTYTCEVSYNGIDQITLDEGIHFPDWLTIIDNGDNTATISGSTNIGGHYQVDILATDGLVQTTQMFLLKVISAPVFITDPETLVAENQEYVYNAEITHSDPYPVFFEEGNEFPDWLTLVDNNDNTALIYGTTDQIGVHHVDLVANGMVNTIQSFDITVGAVPVFTSIPETVIELNVPYIYDITVSYNGTSPCEIIAGANMPLWLTLTDNGNNTATLSGTPISLEAYDVDIVAQGDYFEDNQSFTLDVMVGLDNPLVDQINIYPNPTDNYFYITNMNNTTIDIVDMVGKLMRREKVDSDNYKISVSDFEAGIYIIKSSKNNTILTKKIIIK